MATSEKLKFVIFSSIGVFNTLFDIFLYTVLRSHGQSVIVANILSVSAALIGSYFLNARFTFKHTVWTPKRFLSFVAVTLFGLWVLQTAVIYMVQPAFNGLPSSWWNLLGSLQHIGRLTAPKLAATAVTFVWNYLWYNKVIFKKGNSGPTPLLAAVEVL